MLPRAIFHCTSVGTERSTAAMNTTAKSRMVHFQATPELAIVETNAMPSQFLRARVIRPVWRKIYIRDAKFTPANVNESCLIVTLIISDVKINSILT
jgi:hypothetical protein